MFLECRGDRRFPRRGVLIGAYEIAQCGPFYGLSSENEALYVNVVNTGKGAKIH